MRYPFLAALAVTMFLAVVYLLWQGSKRPAPTVAAPPPPAVNKVAPPPPPPPPLADMTVPDLLVRAQQEMDRGAYDESLHTLSVAHKKDPANPQIAELTEKVLEAKHSTANQTVPAHP